MTLLLAYGISERFRPLEELKDLIVHFAAWLYLNVGESVVNALGWVFERFGYFRCLCHRYVPLCHFFPVNLFFVNLQLNRAILANNAEGIRSKSGWIGGRTNVNEYAHENGVIFALIKRLEISKRHYRLRSLKEDGEMVSVLFANNGRRPLLKCVDIRSILRPSSFADFLIDFRERWINPEQHENHSCSKHTLSPPAANPNGATRNDATEKGHHP